MATLLLLAILSLISVPNWSRLFDRNQASMDVASIVSLLEFARSQAIYSNQRVVVAPENGNWSSGMKVILDGSVVRILDVFKGASSLVWNSSLGQDDILQFQANGFTAGQRGTFYYCAKQFSENSRAIVVAETGRIREQSLSANEQVLHCAF